MSEKDLAAQKLAQAHYAIEPGITQIFRIRRADEEESFSEPIKLLEVNENTIPSGVMPIHFGPAPGIGVTYPSTIVEVTPDEFTRIQSKELLLPFGWTIADPLPKP
jgi:hypothetical protein